MATRPRHITIGDAVSLTRPTTFDYQPDDRQQLIQTIDGAIVEDYGWASSGDKIVFEAAFLWEEASKVIVYWAHRQLVNVTDMSGTEWQDCRIVIKSMKRYEYFEHKAAILSGEIWRV